MRKTFQYLKENFLLFLKGMAIGTAVIIPGVSGGTVAFLLGIYDRMLEAIVGIRRHFMKSLAYLTPILLGAMAAFLALIFPITWAFDNAPLPLVTLFAGLVIGSLPSLTTVIKGQFSPWRLTVMVLGGLLAAGLGILSVVTSFDATPILNTLGAWQLIVIFLVGLVAVSALIVPGISGSMFLLVLGFYAPLTTMIRDFILTLETGMFANLVTPLVVLGVFGLGLLVGFVLISLLMKFLLGKYKMATYYGIIGFILGSLVALYCNYEVVWMYGSLPWWHILIAAALLILGCLASFALARYGKNHQPAKENNDAVGI
jgi:putative membrane protein